MDLSGIWLAHPADEELRREFPSPELDDRAWEALVVPGHWRSSAAFADFDGPLLYRTRFESPPPAEGRRSWLVLDGLFYQGDVWLDGAYVGDTEGYFAPHAFEVTQALQARTEHVLAVEATCSRPREATAKRNLTGVFQHWDCLDPDWNPGGIWRPVRLETSGPLRIVRLRCLCREATEDRAVLWFRATLDALTAGPARLRTRIGGHEHQAVHSLAAGENRVEWYVVIERPDLWWPHALGPQPMHDVVVDAIPGAGREDSDDSDDDKHADPDVIVDAPVSDRRIMRTGIRQVRMDKWVLHVNGERLFLKGANQGPSRMDLARIDPADLARDVALAKAAGLDFLRIHAHISRPEFYDAADQAGLLLWQDLPLQWGYARGVRKQAVAQARAAVDLLGHHPAIAVWCGHNEPFALDPSSLHDPDGSAHVGRFVAKFLASNQLPTWNKTVLDGSIKRALAKSDATRPVVAHSGVLPHVGSGGTDSHLYFGWYHGHERELPGFLAFWPRMARFVSEFGAQAVPNTDGFCEPHRWPDLDWERLARRHSLQKQYLDRVVPSATFASFEEWRDATQAYQATLVKHHIETLRRLKYRPTGGFAQFCFADAYPAITWSVLDHDRVAKAGYHALTEACQPLIVVADRPAAVYSPGDPIALDVHVVSDLRQPVDGAVVEARLSWPGGEQSWRWQGDVPPDSCVRIATLQLIAPDATGAMVLELGFDHHEVKAANRYMSRLDHAE